MIKLYSMPSSGNSYKVRLLLAQLGVPYQHIAVEYDRNVTNMMTNTPSFRDKNPHGKVPLVEFQDGTTLSESNAILHYFAEGTPFIPTSKIERARAYQWMFWEQNSHEPYVAGRMATFNYPQRVDMDRSPPRMAALLASGNHALDVLEVQLAKNKATTPVPFVCGENYSIADICLYGYTHAAGEGGFDVSAAARPHIASWLKRVASQPGHVTIDWLPLN
jgi:glutathione S-transferase